MKALLFGMILFVISNHVFAQTGFFKKTFDANVRTGLAISYFHNFQGEYVYILQQNARVVEEAENKDGASLAFVVIFPFAKDEKFNLLLNVPVLDYKGSSNGLKDNFNFFDSQTPFGIGFAFFPEDSFLGVSLMGNVGRQNRMRESAINNQFFPIANYPNYNLNVGAPVPEAILNPFLHRVTTLSLSVGVTIKF